MKRVGYFIIILLLFACQEITTKWVRKFDAAGPGNYQINDLAVFHTIYVTGAYWTADHNTHCITAAYDEDGELEWCTTYEPPNTKSAEGKAILRNNEGIYVLAQTVDMNGDMNLRLINYNDLGNQQWKADVEKSKGDIASKLLIDDVGDIYVAGSKINDQDSLDIFIAKYDRSGKLVWLTKYYNPALGLGDLKFDIVQPDQFIIAGVSKKTWDFCVLRYDRQGRLLSLIKYENPETEKGLADIKIDEVGTIFLTGASYTSETGYDYLTIAYDKNNNLLWAKRFDSKAHLDDTPRAMVTDESASVYIAGTSKNRQNQSQILTIKYDKKGTLLWSKVFGGGKNLSAEAYLMYPGFLRAGRYVTPNFYVVGMINNDVILLKYSNTGGNSRVITYRGARDKKCMPAAFSDPCLAVQSVSEEGSNATIIKYARAEQIGFARWD